MTPTTVTVQFVPRYFYSTDGRRAASQLVGDKVQVSALADPETQGRAIMKAAEILAKAPKKKATASDSARAAAASRTIAELAELAGDTPLAQWLAGLSAWINTNPAFRSLTLACIARHIPAELDEAAAPREGA